MKSVHDKAAAASSAIPSKIFQFWDKAELPPDLAPLVDTWRDRSGLQHSLINDDEARAYISRTQPRRVSAAYDACAIPAMRSDIYRLCVVLAEGGWYADCSIECLTRIAPLAPAEANLVFYRRWHGGVNNGLFGAAAKHPLIAGLLDQVCSNVEGRVSDNLFLVTGPGVWNRVFPKDAPPPEQAHELAHADIANIAVRFHQELAHKKEGRHWSDLQNQVPIFRD